MLNLKIMESNIAVIVISTLFILTAIIDFFRKRKNNKVKIKGVFPLAKNISDLKKEKIDEQFRLVNEQLEICIYETSILLMDKLNIKIHTIAYYVMKECLQAVSKNFTIQMKKIIYDNNIAKRKGDDWTNYKEIKAKFVLSTNTDVFSSLWNEKLTGITNKEGSEIVREDFVKIFYKHFMLLLESIREASEIYKNEISSKEELLEEILK